MCPLPHPLAVRWLLGFLSLVPRQKSLYEEECFSLQPFFIKQKDLPLQPSADSALGLIGQHWTCLHTIES